MTTAAKPFEGIQIVFPTDKQEIFNRVVTHFAEQKHAAREHGSCKYRTRSGLSCAIGGPFIPDDLYREWMDTAINNTVDAWTRANVFVVASDEIKAFLITMQQTHDNAEDVSELRRRLEIIADDHELDGSLIETITEWTY